MNYCLKGCIFNACVPVAAPITQHISTKMHSKHKNVDRYQQDEYNIFIRDINSQVHIYNAQDAFCKGIHIHLFGHFGCLPLKYTYLIKRKKIVPFLSSKSRIATWVNESPSSICACTQENKIQITYNESEKFQTSRK